MNMLEDQSVAVHVAENGTESLDYVLTDHANLLFLSSHFWFTLQI